MAAQAAEGGEKGEEGIVVLQGGVGLGCGDAARCLSEEIPPCRSAMDLAMGGFPANPLAGFGQEKEFRRHLYPSLVQKAVSKRLDAPASAKSFKVGKPLPRVGVPDLTGSTGLGGARLRSYVNAQVMRDSNVHSLSHHAFQVQIEAPS